ncbi:hypothetical protein PFISCL1PPCAC_18735, partial [Pristionchus fissidentatus]
SGYWRYFTSDPSTPETATCTLCGHKADRPGGNTNKMKGHLKKEHPEEFAVASQAKVLILVWLSKRYLTVPSTSVSAERIFSLAGILFRSHLRNRMSAEKAEELLLLRVNTTKFFRFV